jgi:hypothetical protein
VINPKANRYFDLKEGGVIFRVGDKTICLFREEVISMLLEKYEQLPEDRKPIKDVSLYEYELAGTPYIEAT